MAMKASPAMHSLIMGAVLAAASPALAISPGESTHGQVQVAQQGHAPEPAADSGLSGLSALANQGRSHVSVGDGHWTYEGRTGPVHWGDLSTEFGTCSAGQTQSPIDLDGGIVAASTPIAFDFGDSPMVLENNGHTVVSHYAPGSGITVEGQRFELLQFHFHTPSEHLINGRPAAMEIHFVHKNARGQLAVVGVMVEQGDENPALAAMWQHLPNQQGPRQAISGAMVDGRDLLPGRHSYIRYMGSLTTPPCSEGVNWFVLTTPIQASFTQIMRFATLVGANARPAQAVHNRLILMPF